MSPSPTSRSVHGRYRRDVGESWASSDAARRTMQGNRGRDTRAELAVRRLVHAAGLRYRVNARPEADLRRTADLLFTRARVAVFIDGCYWHGCPEHYRPAKVNRDFWSTKITRNRERDHDTTRVLESRGWMVLRYWEHEPSDEVATSVKTVVRGRLGDVDRLPVSTSTSAAPYSPLRVSVGGPR